MNKCFSLIFFSKNVYEYPNIFLLELAVGLLGSFILCNERPNILMKCLWSLLTNCIHDSTFHTYTSLCA